MRKITTISNKQERTDFVDDNGDIQIAYDLGYSTKIVTNSKNESIEAYFDPNGNKVSRSSGFHAISRSYNDKGQNYRTTYLDVDYKPVIIVKGYSVEMCEYNINNQIDTIRFFDIAGNPVCSTSEGYGKHYEYNAEGKIWRIIYIDQYNNPMMTNSGYAMVERFFYSSNGPNNGRIENEFYYDVHERPISLDLGQYGLHKDYANVGDNIALTYLDSNGNAVRTKKGYTSVSWEYYGSSFVEKYYDNNGQPFMMPEGYYGIKREDGKTYYLDKNGKEQFNFKRLLYNQSVFAIIIAIILIILSINSDRRINVLFLFLYCGAIIYFTLLFREANLIGAAVGLLGSYGQLLTNDKVRAEIIRNIWLFIPLGTIFSRVFHNKKSLLFAIVFSTIIEIIQFYTKTGWFALDDVLSNSLGSIIGYRAGQLLCEQRNSFLNRSNHRNSI